MPEAAGAVGSAGRAGFDPAGRAQRRSEAMFRNWAHRTVTFFQEVRGEMQKVTWPTWAELKGQTIVVVVAVLLIAAFIGAVDLILSNAIKFLVTRLS